MDVQIEIRGVVRRVEWPHGLPRNYTEMFKAFGAFVIKQVARFNRVPRNFEDLHQDICCRLIAGRVLEQFVKRAGGSLPASLTGAEAAAFMGLDRDAFRLAIFHWRKMGLDVGHLSGELFDEAAVFRTAEIVLMDEAFPDASRTLAPTVLWAQPFGFPAYLQRAIQNHFLNWCRTRRRRYKDIYLPANTVVRPDGSGSYTQMGIRPDGADTDWEKGLVSSWMGDDDFLTVVDEIKETLEDAGYDPEHLCEVEVDDNGVPSSRPSERAKQGLAILDSVVEGRLDLESSTIQQALLSQKQRARQRVRVSGGG